jgi:hypothetical protein
MKSNSHLMSYRSLASKYSPEKETAAIITGKNASFIEKDLSEAWNNFRKDVRR